MDLTFSDPAVRRTARLVHALSRDLRSLEQGIGPTIEQLAEAPTLEDWAVGYRLELALAGRVVGHPRLADGPATTSGVYYVDRELGFARTLSRYYRLGQEKSP